MLCWNATTSPIPQPRRVVTMSPMIPEANPAANTLRPRDRQRLETRQKVFQAAIAEFERVGVATAQIENITRAAGVSVGTYYRYFPTRDDVLFELLQQTVERITPEVANVRVDGSLPLVARLQALVMPIFDILEREDSPLLREVFALLVRRQPPDDFDWAEQPLLRPLLEIFAEAQRKGETRYDAVRLTRLFFTALFGFLTSMNPARRRSEAAEFIRLFVRGIAG